MDGALRRQDGGLGDRHPAEEIDRSRIREDLGRRARSKKNAIEKDHPIGVARHERQVMRDHQDREMMRASQVGDSA
jgi:hypothetical protein